MSAGLVEQLGLSRHPEGGWYRETWRCEVELAAHGGTRPAATAVTFLLQPGESSRWHRVRSGELWLWQGGGPLRLRLGGDGKVPAEQSERTVGPDPTAGHDVQWLVRPGEWQAAEPAGAGHCLVACVVSPGFDFADFELA